MAYNIIATIKIRVVILVLFMFAFLYAKAQEATNYGFYRYNWQFFNPAALGYEYFHRIQSEDGALYSSRSLSISSGYRQQWIGLSESRTAQIAHVEYLTAANNQRFRPDQFTFKLGGGIMNNTWGRYRETTPYIGCAKGVRLNKTTQLIAGVNVGSTQIRPDKSGITFKDVGDPDINDLFLPQNTALVVPGVLLTDFRKYYAGFSLFYPFDNTANRQYHVVFGWNFVSSHKIHRTKGGKKADVEVLSVLAYNSGITGWIRYARPNGYENMLGDYSPISAMINYRFQLPIAIGRNTIWSNIGTTTSRILHLEVGYTHFAASSMGIGGTYDMDMRLGVGWDMPLSSATTQLGSSFEINFGIAF